MDRRKELRWPWLLKVLLKLGGVLITIGLALAVGQVLGISWFVVGRGDFFAALQVHLGVVAIGGVAMTVALAARAYQLQREEIEQLRQAPYVEVRWAEKQDEGDVTVEGELATVTVQRTKADHLRLLGLKCLLSNTGNRMASIYEIAMVLLESITTIVGQTQPYGDRYHPRPIRTHKMNSKPHQGMVTYSWVVVQDREFILVPNGSPIEVALLQVDRHHQGPLESAIGDGTIWNREHDLKVTINGDWGSQPPQTLKLKLKLADS